MLGIYCLALWLERETQAVGKGAAEGHFQRTPEFWPGNSAGTKNRTSQQWGPALRTVTTARCLPSTTAWAPFTTRPDSSPSFPRPAAVRSGAMVLAA